MFNCLGCFPTSNQSFDIRPVMALNITNTALWNVQKNFFKNLVASFNDGISKLLNSNLSNLY